MARLKSLVDLITSCDSDTVRPYLALEHIEGGTGRLLPDIELPERMTPASGAAAVEAGDVLFGKLRPYLAKTWLADRVAFASTELLCLRPRSRIDARWLGYVCASRPLVEWAVATSDGTKMPRTSWGKLSEYRVWLPSADTQHAISDFLDVESARIDALVVKKRRLINLSELRVLTEAVERTWQRQTIVPLRRVAARVQTGTTPVAEAHERGPEDRKIEWLSPADFGTTLAIRKAARHLSGKAIRAQLAPVFPAGSVVIVGIGATAGRVGFLDRDASGNQQLTCVTPMSQVDGRFLAWQLLGRTREMREAAPYTTLPILNNDFLRVLSVNLPSFDEQQRIARELDALAGRTRNLINTLERQIELLKEHRQALITAAVTGEMDVPGVSM